ncbi:MAG: hypothetical protein LC802_21475 [Acidobacteria bacterium]|nr:hypothetical protein [Acidobacteriota bacterium]
MAKEDRGHSGEHQQGRHQLRALIPVNDVGRDGQGAQIVHDRNGRLTQLACDLAEFRAVDDGRVAATE